MKSRLLLGALVAGLLVIFGSALWSDGGRRMCVRIGLCKEQNPLGAMLLAVQQEKHLRVLRASLSAPVTSVRDSTLGPVRLARTRQTVILPAVADYFIDLGQLRSEDLVWDSATNTLHIHRPPMTVDAPRIDWDKAQVYSDGNWMTVLTDVRERLSEDNRQRAPQLFQEQARAPELLQMAELAADDAIAMLFRMPLIAAGHTDPKVIVTH